MNHILCPTCFHSFHVENTKVAKEKSIAPCPNCGLSMNHEINITPEPTQKETVSRIAESELLNRITVIAGLTAISAVILLALATSRTNTPPTSTYDSPASSSTSTSSREAAIDKFADRQVEEHWRPMPGGNSKEDAKAVTADILKARNWEELNAAYLRLVELVQAINCSSAI